MAKSAFSIYDFTAHGLRMTFDHVRLFILTALAFVGIMLVAALSTMLIAFPVFMKLKSLIPSLKQIAVESGMGMMKGGMGMMQDGTGMGGGMGMMQGAAGMHSKMMLGMWQQISPMLTTIDFMLLVLGVFFFLVVMFGLILGFLRIVLDVFDHGDSTVSRLVSCFHLAPRFFIASLISMVLVLAGLLLFILPGIILMLRLRFFPYYIIDKNNGIIESLKASWRATKGLEWEILGLNIVAAVLAMIVPVFGIPVSCFMMASAYRVLPKQ